MVSGRLLTMALERAADEFGGGIFQLEFLIDDHDNTKKLTLTGIKEISRMSLMANDDLYIQVTDISGRRWDRFAFEVKEISEDMFRIFCSGAQLTDLSV